MWWKRRTTPRAPDPPAPATPEEGAGTTDAELVDCRGLLCPLPLLRARSALDRLPPGSLIELVATDAGAVADFDAFCGETGHELERQAVGGGEYRFWIRKSGSGDGAAD